MEELVKTVSEKAEIDAEKARKAIIAVVDFLKTKMPGLGNQISGLLAGGGQGTLGEVLGSVRDKFRV